MSVGGSVDRSRKRSGQSSNLLNKLDSPAHRDVQKLVTQDAESRGGSSSPFTLWGLAARSACVKSSRTANAALAHRACAVSCRTATNSAQTLHLKVNERPRHILTHSARPLPDDAGLCQRRLRANNSRSAFSASCRTIHPRRTSGARRSRRDGAVRKAAVAGGPCLYDARFCGRALYGARITPRLSRANCHGIRPPTYVALIMQMA